ncbi:hypothetical protein, partial [Sinorhizobium meliloti]|uniref:hypothetical protein n=1 Tax=Rhizobium meliloti TaxID=382 RepID=UPI001AECBDAC
FSPGHRDLHRIFANPTESQLAEITQFFLRQPLRRVHSDPDNLFHGRPPLFEICNDLMLAHFDAVRGSSTPTIFVAWN